MSSRMMKRLFIASVLVLAFPVVASASTSRLAGMGTQGDYTKDYTNIFGYPSCVSQVGNVVYGEFGQVVGYDNSSTSEYYTTEDRTVGAVLGNLFDGKYGTFAFNIREISPPLGAGSQPLTGLYSSALGTTHTVSSYYDNYAFGTGFETYQRWIDPNAGYQTEAFDLLWGKKFDKISLGLRLNRSAYKYTSDQGTTHTSEEGYDSYNDRNIFGFGVGLGYQTSDKLSSELGILYQSRTYKFKYSSGTVDESDGGGTYLISARSMWQWQPNVLVVPVARIYSFGLDTKYTPAGSTVTKYGEKLSGWQAGVAGNWTVNQKDLFVTGVTFASNTYDYTGREAIATDKDKTTESIMPTLFASLETKTNSWLTLRFGARKGVFYSVKREYFPSSVAAERTDKTSYSPFQFFLGTGVKLGTLQLDATLAQDFFHNPATYVSAPTSGANYYSPLFPKVTATYTF